MSLRRARAIVLREKPTRQSQTPRPQAGTQIVGNDAWLVNLNLAGLTRVVAVSDFTAGRAHNSVAAMARRAASAMFASGFASRGSVRKHLESIYPDLTGVSAVVAGDVEMTRAASTPLGVGSGAVDVYVRSKSRYVLTQLVRLAYVAEQDSEEVGKFIGTWTPEGTPTRVDSVQWAGDDTLPLVFKVFAKSSDAARAPLLSCSYSGLEAKELVVDMPKDGSNQLITTIPASTRPGPLIVPHQKTDENGNTVLITPSWEERTVRAALGKKKYEQLRAGMINGRRGIAPGP